MHRWMTVTRALTALTALTAFAALPLQAQNEAEPQALVLTAHNLMAGDARHKELAARGADTSALLPGDVVRYTLHFTNVTPGPVRGVVFNNPIPAGLRYVGGSAGADRDDVAVTYSIDRGRTYAAQPLIEVEENGKRLHRPAPPEMYTHIRWTVQGHVQPGTAVTATFRAALPVAAETTRPTPADSTRRPPAASHQH